MQNICKFWSLTRERHCSCVRTCSRTPKQWRTIVPTDFRSFFCYAQKECADGDTAPLTTVMEETGLSEKWMKSQQVKTDKADKSRST